MSSGAVGADESGLDESVASNSGGDTVGAGQDATLQSLLATLTGGPTDLLNICTIAYLATTAESSDAGGGGGGGGEEPAAAEPSAVQAYTEVAEQRALTLFARQFLEPWAVESCCHGMLTLYAGTARDSMAYKSFVCGSSDVKHTH
jgi:hypothetical protein